MAKKLFITGLYGCNCHPFKNWKECDLFHKQQFKLGDIVNDRCTGRKGIIAKRTDKQFFCLVKFGPNPSNHHQYHSANLVRSTDPIDYSTIYAN